MSTIIKIDKVSKAFLRRVILKDVSLSVEAGHTVGIVGSNGSGKSVLFQIICGFLVPDSGIVSVRDQALGNSRDFPENMGVLINSPGFISLDTGLQNLRYLAGIRGVIGDQEIRDAMKKVGLDPEDRTKVEHYSLGMKQKLGLAQAIMEGQDILVLDEPFNALDYKTYNDVKEIIRTLHAEGKTILMLVETMDYEQATPSLSQAQRMKKFSQEGKLSEDVMLAIMSEEKKGDLDKVTLSSDTLRKYFPKSYTPAKMQETIIKLLEQWQKKRQRDQER